MSTIEWLSIESSEFIGHIFDLSIIKYSEHDYETLIKIAPDRAYVIDLEYRTQNLFHRFQSLNVVYKMLGINEFPVESSFCHIYREEWIRATLDLLLSRFTSVRDCIYLLVAEVFELGLEPRKISLQNLLKNQSIGQHTDIYNLLDEISKIGKNLREERNENFHEGVQRSLGDDDITYKLSSLLEFYGQRKIYINNVDINLDGLHNKVVEEIRCEFDLEVKRLETKLLEILDKHLHPIFLQRWRAKRVVSQLD
jgi:Cthe_2314-like HEPN